MGGFASIVRGSLAGLNEAAGNPGTAQALQDKNQQAEQAHVAQVRAQVMPHALAIKGLQAKLAATEDPHEKAALTHDIARNLAEVRGIIYPDKDPKGNFFERGITEKLHLSSLKARQDKLKQQQAKGAKQDESGAASIAQGTVPYGQTPAALGEAQKSADAQKLQELRNAGAQQKGANTRPVPYYAGAVNLDTANSMSQQGVQFNGEDGEPYELSQIPKGSVLIPVYLGGGKSYWSIATDKGRYETANNQRMLQPSVGGPNPEAPSIGAVRVPTSAVSTQTSPGGAQVVTGTRTTTPENSAISPTSPTGATPPKSGPVLHERPFVGPGTKSVAQTRDMQKVQSEGVLPNIQNMTPNNARLAAKAQPAVTALLGLYGDPQNPNAPSMVEYAKLANNPHSQQVLGAAFKLLDQSMGEISDPGILQTLATAGGWANFRAQAEAGAQQQAGTEMTPEERSYFDAAISSMADIIGSRSATGQSAARFSVKSIQNELPLIGLSGTPDSTSYLTKMQTIGRQIRVGLNGMPDNSRALAWLNKREADIEHEKGAISHPAAKAQKVIVQHSPSTGKYRYSTDGEKTWQPGQPPK